MSGRDRNDGKGGGAGLWGLLLALAALGGLIGWLASEYGDRLDWSQDGPRLAYLLLLVPLVAAGAFGARRFPLGSAGKAILLWVAVGGLAVIGYTYRDDLTGLWRSATGRGDAETGRPDRGDADRGRDRADDRRDESDAGSYTVKIRQSADGHYYAQAMLDGASMRLLVDTGATSTVLSKAAAARAGIYPAAADYVVQVRTGNGVVRAARATVRDFRMGGAQFRDVPALVIDSETLGVSVLGITTLQRFKSYEVQGGVLTLRW